MPSHYLGVTFLSGKHTEIDCNTIKHKFYAACTCVFSICYGISEVIQLQLQESYCLPILTYATLALNLSSRQLQEINACWNGVYRKIFKCHQWESVKNFICGIGRCDFIHTLAMRNFCHMKRCTNITLCNVFHCVKLSGGYMKLLTLYQCGSSDSVYCVNVERHFAAIADSQ